MASVMLPRRLLVGGGSVQQLGLLVKSLGCKSPLVVSDAFLASATSGALDKVQSALETEGLPFDAFTDTIPDPTTDSVGRCVAKLAAGSYDSIIALGGGSPMDTAKAAAALHTHGGHMCDYKAPYQMDTESKIPLIAIPTTSGSGSEVTKFTIVTDSETDEKMLCIGLAYLPVAAVLDFEFTLTKPLRLTADTGIDAMCHAMEAYVSRKSNSFSDSMALQALPAIGSNLRTACFDPQNRAAREAMMMASTKAGMAFSNSSVTLIHGMSRPLGATFHVPHGMSNAMLAPLCTKFSVAGAVERYADAARSLGFCPAQSNDALASETLPEAIAQLSAELEVPSLEGFGIKESDFRAAVPAMAAAALASGSPNNNPIIPTQVQVEDLYHAIWDAGLER